MKDKEQDDQAQIANAANTLAGIDHSDPVIHRGELQSEGRPMQVIVVEALSSMGKELKVIGVVGDERYEGFVFLSNKGYIESDSPIDQAVVKGIQEGRIATPYAQITFPADMSYSGKGRLGDSFNLLAYMTKYCAENLPKRGVKHLEAVVTEGSAFQEIMSNAGFIHNPTADYLLKTRRATKVDHFTPAGKPILMRLDLAT